MPEITQVANRRDGSEPGLSGFLARLRHLLAEPSSRMSPTLQSYKLGFISWIPYCCAVCLWVGYCNLSAPLKWQELSFLEASLSVPFCTLLFLIGVGARS